MSAVLRKTESVDVEAGNQLGGQYDDSEILKLHHWKSISVKTQIHLRIL